MYRSDKQFMRDPATANARIYIGNIAEAVVAENLDQKFRVHGKILGLVLQRGFGFIQYESDYQAKAAIEAEHGCMFYGKKLNVKQAYAQVPNQGPPNKQFPYQQNNNQNPNFQQHQNIENPREFERDMNRPSGQQYEQQHRPQNTGPQQQNQMQHQSQHQPLSSPQKNHPPPLHNMQQQSSQQPFPSPQQQKGHPPAHQRGNMPQQQQQQQHSQNDQSIPESREPLPMDRDDGRAQGGDRDPVVGPGGAPMRSNSPSMGSGGPGGPSDSRRGKKRRRGGGRERERELDRHGLPLDYR